MTNNHVRILKVLLETGFRVSGSRGFRSSVRNTPLSRRGLLERGGVSGRPAEGGFWNRVFSRSWFSETLSETPGGQPGHLSMPFAL